MDIGRRLLELLADGIEHGGEALAEALDVNSGELDQCLERVQSMGVELTFSSDRRVRWRDPVGVLDRKRIVDQLNAAARDRLADLQLLTEVDSTNRFLLDAARAGAPSGMACMAEYQSAGRGSRGRGWVSPFGNLYLSVLWRFVSAERLRGLSLALGVAVVEALASMEIEGLELKWPNDITRAGKKVGGILIETLTMARGCLAVAGIGVNYSLSRTLQSRVDQAWTALNVEGSPKLDRNHVAARMIEGSLTGLSRFEQLGFAGFRERWYGLDALRGRKVMLTQPHRKFEAWACGIDESGALLISSGGEMERIHAGEVSVRPLD